MKTRALVFIIIAALLTTASKAQTPQDMTAKQITIRNKQVTINYYQQGQGDTTLLFLHGWCINGGYWKDQVDNFSINYTVYAIDLPGFGQSKAERTDWTIEEYAHDVTAFIEALNLKHVVLIGHSMAGEIMLQAALTNNPRISGIIGVDYFKAIDVVLPPEAQQQINDFIPLLERDFAHSAPVYADLMLLHPSTSSEVKDRVKADYASSNPVIGYGTMMNQMRYTPGDPQRLEQLNYKLYLINSDVTPTNEAGLQHHCKKGYHVVTIAATGHFPMIEKPAAFNRLLEKVLVILSQPLTL